MERAALPVIAFMEETMSEPETNGKLERLRDSQLPMTHNATARDVNALRRSLEAAVIDRWGSISVSRAGRINTAVRAEKAARMLGTLLRRNHKTLDPREQADMQIKIVQLSEKRDLAIDRLQLVQNDHKQRKALDVMFEPTPPEEAPADES